MDAGSVDLPPAVICTVEAARSGASVRLRGRIVSPEPASGHYRLEIVKQSRSGTSRVGQAGEFSSSSNEPALVGSTTVDFASGTHIVARLSGDVLGRSFACNLEETSDD